MDVRTRGPIYSEITYLPTYLSYSFFPPHLLWPASSLSVLSPPFLPVVSAHIHTYTCIHTRVVSPCHHPTHKLRMYVCMMMMMMCPLSRKSLILPDSSLPHKAEGTGPRPPSSHQSKEQEGKTNQLIGGEQRRGRYTVHVRTYMHHPSLPPFFLLV